MHSLEAQHIFSPHTHQLALEPDSPYVFLSCGEDGGVMEVDLREDPPKRKRILMCRSPKSTRIALYSVFIDPSNYNYFAISGREQFARYSVVPLAFVGSV